MLKFIQWLNLCSEVIPFLGREWLPNCNIPKFHPAHGTFQTNGCRGRSEKTLMYVSTFEKLFQLSAASCCFIRTMLNIVKCHCGILAYCFISLEYKGFLKIPGSSEQLVQHTVKLSAKLSAETALHCSYGTSPFVTSCASFWRGTCYYFTLSGCCAG